MTSRKTEKRSDLNNLCEMNKSADGLIYKPGKKKTITGCLRIKIPQID